MASIEERPRAGEKSSWRVYWRLGGRGGRKQSVTLPTRKLAESAQQLAEARAHRITDAEVYAAVLGLDQTDIGDRPPTLAEFAAGWITDRRDSGEVQNDTIDKQQRMLMRWVLGELGHLPLTPDYFDRDRIKQWVAWLRKRPKRGGGLLDADTVRRVHSTLHSLLGAAVPRWLPANPCARPAGQRKTSNLPKTTPHDAIFLTAFEVDLILRNCPPAIRPLVFTAVRTGLRMGELLALRVQDVTLTGKRKTIRVRRALKTDGSIGAPKSARSRRELSIHADVVEALKPLVRGKRTEDLVFTAPKGGIWNPSNLHNRYWAPALAAAQRCPEHPPPLPPKPKSGPRRKLRPDEVSTCLCETRLHRRPRFHDLRHTFVSLCAAAGMSIVTVSWMVGHESIDTTVRIYGHFWHLGSDEDLDAVAKLLLIADDEAA